MRQCSLCEKSLPKSEFYKDARTQDGLTRRCRECHSRKSYESRKKYQTPHARYEYDRARRLRRDYGITVDQYDQMFAAQNGVCRICKRSEPHRYGALHVDHDHLTGVVRGLLCSNCNTGLGKFRDDPELLAEAIAYLCCEGAPLPDKQP